MSYGFIRNFGRKFYPKKTTRYCKLEFEWNDISLSWILLKDLKPSHHVELAEYSVANNTEY